MALGKYNRIMGKLLADTTITGDGNDNAVAGAHFVLPCKAELDVAYASISSMAGSKTTAFSVYVDASTDYKVVDQLTTITSAVLSGKMTRTAAYVGKVYDAGTVFYAKEQCTASSDVVGFSIDLCFREMEP